MTTIPKLDDIDRRILRELRRDGRISNARLAERVGLSATPCWNRVKALEDAGVISGYAALLNQKALGLPDTVLIEVTLDRHDDDMLHRFGEALAQLPEVLEAHLLTGEYDYLIKVAVSGAWWQDFGDPVLNTLVTSALAEAMEAMRSFRFL